MNIYTQDEEGEMMCDRTIKLPCKDHLLAKVLCVEAAGREYLALYCSDCRDTKLLDVETGTSVLAVRGLFHRMCNGEKNRLFVETFFGNITELDCLTLPFTEIKTIKTGLKGLACFVPCPPRLMFLDKWSYQRGMHDVSMDSSIIWTVESRDFFRDIIYVDGLGLLVGGRGKVVVHDPEDGSHLQTVDLQDVDLVQQLVAFDKQIIVLHDANKLSFYDVIIKRKEMT